MQQLLLSNGNKLTLRANLPCLLLVFALAVSLIVSLVSKEPWLILLFFLSTLVMFRSRLTSLLHGLLPQNQVGQQIAASEQKYRALFENAYDSILVIDSNGKIALVNERLYHTFGYRPDELIGQPLEILIPERYRGHHIALRDSYLRAPQTRSIGRGLDLHARRKDGTEFPVDISLSPTYTREGLRVTANIRDITEKKRLEDQQSFLFQSGNILSETTDYRERLQRIANVIVPKIADICVIGLPEEDGLFIAVASRGNSQLDLLKTMASKQLASAPVFVGEVRSQSKDKRFQMFGITSYLSVPLKSGKKSMGTLSLSMTDSGRKFVHGDVTFAEIVASRCSIAVENARLYQSAKDAVKARERILSIVSHDLKNPVASVLMSAQLLTKENLAHERITELAEVLKNSSLLMQRLISDLLDFAKIDEGMLEVQKENVDVQNILDAAMKLMTIKASAKNISLKVLVGENIPSIYCDRDRIVQVIWNLVGNAIKFTPKDGSVSIDVTVLKHFVQITVSDTGPGIADKDIARIFDRFWQAKETASLGSGLGLSIAKGIVESHGGKIWVESRVGQGSKFHFTIPSSPAKFLP